MTPVKDFFSKVTNNRKGSHILFWAVILFAVTIAKSSSEIQEQSFLILLGRNVINLIAPLFAAYFLNYYLIPKFFYQKKFLSFILFFIFSAYLFCVIGRILNVHVAEALFRAGEFKQESVAEIFVQLDSLLSVYFPGIYFVAFAMTFIKQQKSQLEMRQRNVLLEKEKTETELNFLKAQIHPHFLFNTLNNLYVLTLKKSDKAPEIVVKLSEILDYILYKGNDEEVTLDKEIKLLENYISLEKLRYDDQLQVSFQMDVDDMHVGISPLLLLSIVENAFKHGASSQLTKPEIKIDLYIRDKFLTLKVYNTKNENVQTDGTDYRKGIGVTNIQRQLALIYNDYNFEIEEGKDSYLVNLYINLENRQ